MIYNSLIYIAFATFAIAFALDLVATIRQAWIAAAPVATPVAAPTATPAPAVQTATIASKTPQTTDDYNGVLTVEQLRRKARAAGIKNSGKMRKNQLLAALA